MNKRQGPKFWRTREFDSLNKEWSSILKNEGFKDCEKELHGERVLRRYADYDYRHNKTPKEMVEERAAYYLLLYQMALGEAHFADDSDRLIMLRTSEGKSIREISLELQSMGKPKHNRDTIRYIRRRYEHKWGIRIWLPAQMVSRRPPSRS